MRVRLQEPDRCPLPLDTLGRLFADVRLTESRLERLAHWPRLVAACGNAVVGIVTYQRVDEELRAPDFGLDRGCGCSALDVVTLLIDALETACLATGCRRLVLMPPHDTPFERLARRGYRAMSEGCAGTWLEKTFR